MHLDVPFYPSEKNVRQRASALRTRYKTVALTLGLLLPFAAAISAQTTTGSLTGTLVDAQGGAVPNTAITLNDPSRNVPKSTTSDETGRFAFTAIQPGNYVLEIKAKGFKTHRRDNVVVQANDRLTLGEINLEVGQIEQVIEVTAQAVALKTESAERSDILVTKQLENVAVNGRSYLALAALTPGVVSTGNFQTGGTGGLGNISANGARMNQNQLTLNGISNVDTGNNGDQLATISLDSVQEYRILTGIYQAEFGRSSGAQISVVTKSGTNAFHGSGYYYRRHDSMNANDWLSNRDGRPRKLYRYNNPGYTIGGPIWIPGTRFNKDKNKLFFFWSQEYQDQLQPEGVRRVTVPTDLERQGNFSQSIDRGGNKIFIKDYTLDAPCHAGNTTGCYANNIIPSTRLYQPGLALMKLFPAATTDKTITRDFNLESQISTSKPRREDLVRADYNLTDKLRVWGHFINNKNSTTTPYGSFVLGSNLPSIPITDARPGKSLGLGFTWLLSPTSTNEFTFGRGRNDILIAPAAGPTALSRAATGATLPVLYPSAVQDDYIPAFGYAGSRIANSNSYGTGRAPFVNYNETWDFIDNFSKVSGSHLFKIGAYIQKSMKDQSPDGNPNGNYDFGDTSQTSTGVYQNPFDTGYGFANMASGVFNTFQQNNRYYMGKYRYINAEFYIQDTWKVNRRLTLDYGMRFAWIQPQYESSGLASGFRPENYDPSKAVRLYRPGVNSAGQNIAVDPGTGATLGAFAVGRVVPNSGDLLNGVVVGGVNNVSKYLMKNRGLHYGPRFGLAYDLTGNQNFILRAGGGVYYDRYQGNRAFAMTNNPPNAVPAQVNYGLVSQLNTGVALAAVPSLRSFDPNGEVPTVYNFTIGIQNKLPGGFVLDTAYVGSLSRHLQAQINLNAIPYGTTFRPQNAGITNRDFLRPFPGFGDITYYKADATANYNSLQVSLNRRMARNLFFGMSYTWSKALTTASADGDFMRIDSNTRKANYALADFHRAHNMTVNWVYEIPTPFKNNALTKHTLGGWQVSGIFQAQTGLPQTIGFSIPGVANETLTGSFTEGARIRLVGNPATGFTKDVYHNLNPAAFLPPTAGSTANPTANIGMEAPNRYFILPGINNWTLSLQKSFRIAEKVNMQFRADAFNVFNHTQFSDIGRTANFANLNATTPNNLPTFDTANNRWINPTGFGAVTAVRDPRIIQLMFRVQF
jgi:hypothetical protein